MEKKERFIQAIRSNEGLIYKVASLYTDDREDRNDLMQEIIYQLWRSFDSFDNRSGLSTWIYRVAMNVSIYQYKRSKRKIRTIPVDKDSMEIHETDVNDMEEKLKALRQQLDKLNLLDKGIVMLYLDNRSYEEIAQVIGISETNVGTKLSRIKEKLKQQLTKNL